MDTMTNSEFEAGILLIEVCQLPLGQHPSGQLTNNNKPIRLASSIRDNQATPKAYQSCWSRHTKVSTKHKHGLNVLLESSLDLGTEFRCNTTIWQLFILSSEVCLMSHKLR
ncbi:hypothetical protein BgiMline_007242 [Biomphalaria glabrata]